MVASKVTSIRHLCDPDPLSNLLRNAISQSRGDCSSITHYYTTGSVESVLEEDASQRLEEPRCGLWNRVEPRHSFQGTVGWKWILFVLLSPREGSSVSNCSGEPKADFFQLSFQMRPQIWLSPDCGLRRWEQGAQISSAQTHESWKLQNNKKCVLP